MTRERSLDAVCRCGCGTAIPSVDVKGRPMLTARGHWARYAAQRRTHDRIVARIRSIPSRDML